MAVMSRQAEFTISFLLNDYLDNIWRVLQILTLVRAERSYLMANTFSQIYIQTVFAVSGRLSLITSDLVVFLFMG